MESVLSCPSAPKLLITCPSACRFGILPLCPLWLQPQPNLLQCQTAPSSSSASHHLRSEWKEGRRFSLPDRPERIILTVDKVPFLAPQIFLLLATRPAARKE